MNDQITISVTLTVPDQFCRDVLCTAVETGSNYWAVFSDARMVDYGTGPEYDVITCAEYGDENEPASTTQVDVGLIREGIRRLAARDFNKTDDWAIPHQTYTDNIRSALTDNDAGMIDADAADIILQLAVFGHLIYG